MDVFSYIQTPHKKKKQKQKNKNIINTCDSFFLSKKKKNALEGRVVPDFSGDESDDGIKRRKHSRERSRSAGRHGASDSDDSRGNSRHRRRSHGLAGLRLPRTSRRHRERSRESKSDEIIAKIASYADDGGTEFPKKAN